MNKVFTIAVASLFSLFLVSCNTTPADYCETVMNECVQLDNNTKEFTQQIASRDMQKIQETYDQNLKDINETISKLQAMGDCRGQAYLVESAIRYAQSYKEIYENEYATFIQILSKEKKTYEDGDIVALSVDDIAKKNLEAKSDLIKNFSRFVKDFELNASY